MNYKTGRAVMTKTGPSDTRHVVWALDECFFKFSLCFFNTDLFFIAYIFCNLQDM